MSFWNRIEKPIIGLSPMDGVTDSSFRFITAKYGRPDVLFTEFTNVEGICLSPRVLLDDLIYHDLERPVVAQVYGYSPESFYKVAHIVCELGFDGLDINMGCPAKNVASRGCGAALILDPPRAKAILQATRQGVEDWAAGRSLSDIQFESFLVERVVQMNLKRTGSERPSIRREIPVSVKTRIGYDKNVIEQWIPSLLEEKPAAISIHGRTLKQMYRGEADWGAISQAVHLARGTGTLILGNGDLASMDDVLRRVRETKVDGALIGRAALGAPWIFRNKVNVKNALRNNFKVLIPEQSVDLKERFQILREHTHHYHNLKDGRRFVGMRKHFGWYCKSFYKASDLRVQLLQTENPREVEALLAQYTLGIRKEFLWEEALPSSVSESKIHEMGFPS